MNRVSHHINVSLANTLSLNLKEVSEWVWLQSCDWLLPFVQWVGTWRLSLQLMSSLLDSLTHQFIGHALDFVGVYQERFALVRAAFVRGRGGGRSRLVGTGIHSAMQRLLQCVGFH
jgi:hypothetical protein